MITVSSSLRRLLPLALAVLLTGCGSSPPIQYHALSSAPRPAESAGSARILVEVLPIALPERLNRNEVVLTGSSGRLDVRATDQWAAPLADEMRQIVSDALWRRVRAADVYQAPVVAKPDGPPHYRLAVRIERFEAVAGRQATVEATWTARRLPQGAAQTCRAAASAAIAGTTTEASVEALSEASSVLAAQIAEGLAGLDAGASCPLP